MKIFVVPRNYIEKQIDKNPNWIQGKWIISIFSKDSFSPISNDRFNVLKLEFDDVAERDLEVGWNIFESSHEMIFFNEGHAKSIHKFIKDIPADSNKQLFVHCDAGVSRSGAVGYILNEWFNKYLDHNEVDNSFFQTNNSHIMPNPLVVRLLKNELFGLPFANIEVNDYEYDEDGNKIDHIEEI